MSHHQDALGSATREVPEVVQLAQEWSVGDRIGRGGFGNVHTATGADGTEAAIKFVYAEPGADRELLLTEMSGRRNIVPVIDQGSIDGYHVLVMPRAEKSLRQHLTEVDGPLSTNEVRKVATDIALALRSLASDVVHRDLKPENVLLLNDSWMVTDFGISRYVDASTATNTRAHYGSGPYAAPEWWKNERATAATDVYALGVMMFEMLAGHRPFEGNAPEDLADAHLHMPPPRLQGVPPTWESAVDECLSKSPRARPTVENLLSRLSNMATPEPSTGLGALATVNASVVRHRTEADAEQQRKRTEAERRQQLVVDASRRFDNLAATLIETLKAAAPSGQANEGYRRTFTIGQAQLEVVGAEPFDGEWRSPHRPVFDVAAFGHISVENLAAKSSGGYYGRSHSLWFGDIQEEGVYGWFETAFMERVTVSQPLRRVNPLALGANEENAPGAVWNGVSIVQVAWPFEPFTADTVDRFIERWSSWLAQAADGRLSHPSRMPERPVQGSWRTR